MNIEITLPEGKESLNKQEIEDLFIRPYAEMVDKAFADYVNKINELQSQLREAIQIIRIGTGYLTVDRDITWRNTANKFLQSVEGSK